MKKLILALAAVALLGTAAQAQKINKEALLQKIEKNEIMLIIVPMMPLAPHRSREK